MTVVIFRVGGYISVLDDCGNFQGRGDLSTETAVFLHIPHAFLWTGDSLVMFVSSPSIFELNIMWSIYPVSAPKLYWALLSLLIIL